MPSLEENFTHRHTHRETETLQNPHSHNNMTQSSSPYAPRIPTNHQNASDMSSPSSDAGKIQKPSLTPPANATLSSTTTPTRQQQRPNTSSPASSQSVAASSSTSSPKSAKKLSGYQLFTSELTNADPNVQYWVIGKKWKALSDEEREAYKKKATEINISNGVVKPPTSNNMKLDAFVMKKGKEGLKTFDPFEHVPPSSVKIASSSSTSGRKRKKSSPSVNSSTGVGGTKTRKCKRKKRRLIDDEESDENSNPGGDNETSPAADSRRSSFGGRAGSASSSYVGRRSATASGNSPRNNTMTTPSRNFASALQQFRAPAAVQNVEREDLKSPSSKFFSPQRQRQAKKQSAFIPPRPLSQSPQQQHAQNTPSQSEHHSPRAAGRASDMIIPNGDEKADDEYLDELDNLLGQVLDPEEQPESTSTTPTRHPTQHFASQQQHRNLQESATFQSQYAAAPTQTNYQDPYPFTNGRDQNRQWENSEIVNLFAGVERFGSEDVTCFEKILTGYSFKPFRVAKDLQEKYHRFLTLMNE